MKQIALRDHGTWIEGPVEVRTPLAPNEVPATVINEAFDPATHYRRGPSVRIENGDGIVEYTLVEKPLWRVKAERIEHLAARRFDMETGGIVVNGVDIPTDRTTQDRVDQIVKAYDDGDIVGPIDFKGGSTWVSLDETALRAIKTAGAQHIQHCFTRERQLAEAINAASSVAEVVAIDINGGWDRMGGD